MRVLLLLLLPALVSAQVEARPGKQFFRSAGAARLSKAPAALPAASNCPITDMDLNGSVQDSIAATDCRVQDIDTRNTVQTYAKAYRVTLTQAGVLAATMSSSNFNTNLYLYTADFSRFLASQRGSGSPSTALLTISLEAGAYIVLASSRVVSTGAFTLTTSFQPLRNCSVQDLTLGQTVNGSLSSSSCRFLDLSAPSTDASFVDVYRFKVASRTVLTIQPSSPDFDPYIELHDSDDLAFAGSDPDADPTAPIKVSLPPGAYTLLVSEWQTNPGAYTFSAAAEDPRPCPVQDIGSNDNVRGRLASDGCRFLDLIDYSSDETPIDQYRLAVGKNSVATVQMSSAVFDTAVLLLVDPKGVTDSSRITEITESADWNENVLTSLKEGTYVIWTYPGDPAGGAYTLRTILEDPRACTARSLGPNDSVTAQLSNTCRVLDLLIPSNITNNADAFQLTVTERSVENILMTSTDFQTATLLYSPDLDSSKVSRSVPRTNDSRLYVGLTPGTYLLFAVAADIGVGGYTLTTTSEQPKSCTAKEIGTGETVTGTLSAESCRGVDFISFSQRELPADVYQVTVTSTGVLTVDMTSPQVDCLLTMYDSAFKFVDQNDDFSDTDSSAELKVLLTPGTYYILADTPDRSLGDYTLRTQFRPSPPPQ